MGPNPKSHKFFFEDEGVLAPWNAKNANFFAFHFINSEINSLFCALQVAHTLSFFNKLSDLGPPVNAPAHYSL